MKQVRLPRLGPGNGNRSPHVVILGSGASKAACPDGARFGRVLPELRDLSEVCGLIPLFNKHHISGLYEDFEAIYSSLKEAGTHEDLCKELERNIREYFLEISIPHHATIYDRLLLSLREKDLVATFNWDPLLAQAYQRNAGMHRLPEIIFLHGNVEVGVCYTCKKKGWISQTCHNCSQQLSPVPLLYPIAQKNYAENPFIAGEWERILKALEDAYLLTIFGYSAPATDKAAMNLMKKAWAANKYKTLAQIEVIDIKSEEDLAATWRPFIVRDHWDSLDSFEQSSIATHPRRSCDAFAAATLMLKPWKDNLMPKVNDIASLHKWLEPLLAEEGCGDLAQAGFSGEPCPPLLI